MELFADQSEVNTFLQGVQRNDTKSPYFLSFLQGAESNPDDSKMTRVSRVHVSDVLINHDSVFNLEVEDFSILTG